MLKISNKLINNHQLFYIFIDNFGDGYKHLQNGHYCIIVLVQRMASEEIGKKVCKICLKCLEIDNINT